MNAKKFYSGFGLVIIALGTLTLIGLVNGLGSSLRFDLTDSKLYTLSEGTEAIVEALETPVTLKFFFSHDAALDLPQVRSYGRRVQELLEEMRLLNASKVKLDVINPEPFSEDEDTAAEYGLRSIPNQSGEEIFFGLVALNEAGETQIIPILRPDRESQLEYEIAQAIYRLGNAKTPVLGLISSIDVGGGFDIMSGRPKQPWVFFSQVEQLFEVRKLEAEAKEIAADIDLLVLIHPKTLADETLYAIDQFVLSGGRLLGFFDPSADLGSNGQAADNALDPGLAKLLSAWGIQMPNKVLLDDVNAVSVGRQGGQPRRHLGVYGLTGANIDDEDIITAQLNTLNIATAGVFIAQADSTRLTITPLLQSSERTQLVDASVVKSNPGPVELSRNFVSENNIQALAVRIAGQAKTAFPGGDLSGNNLDASDEDAKDKKTVAWDEKTKDAPDGHLTEGEIQVVLVGDSDLLADQMWVQTQQFFGQNIVQPFADNGTFVLNALENLAGSSDLISIRSRAVHARPFDKVVSLRQEAGEAFRAKEKALNTQLAETERKLAELQQPPEDGVLTLTDEQQDALLSFQKERIKVRKQLREVQHQLNSDIDRLGVVLKLINILLIPMLVIVGWIGYVTLKPKIAS